MDLAVFQLEFYIFIKTKYQTIFQLFLTYHSLQEFFLLFWIQPQLSPYPQKNSKLEVSNYRPISLLSNIDKIFEKLMHSRLLEFLEGKQILYYIQFGFGKDFSTNLAILTLLESIQKALDDGQFACRIFIDLEKALRFAT